MIPKQPFGQTGHMSTRTIFGGAAISRVDQDQADRTLECLFQHGVNHIDTAASYGESELRIGPWMNRYREQFFLATKTGERTYLAAKEGIQRSLERLRVDHVDLLQLHNLVEPGEWEVAMGPGGALEAAIEARDQGLTRFIGVTGHGVAAPAAHLRSILRFPFHSVLLPYNYVMMNNPQYAADFEVLIEACHQHNVAVQTIKGLTLGPWGDSPRNHSTWYQPLEDQANVDRAVHWLLSRPGIYLNAVGDVGLLPKVLSAADRFQSSPTDREMEEMVHRLAMAPLFT